MNYNLFAIAHPNCLQSKAVTNYPRNMVGYGPTPPDPRWPGGARLALQFVLNYEEGAERNVLHGDAASETFLSEIVGAAGVRGRAAHEHGVALRIRQPRRRVAPAAAVRAASVPLTVFGVAMALERNREAVAAMCEAGHEIASHGWRWISYQFVDEHIEREHMALAVEDDRAS